MTPKSAMQEMVSKVETATGYPVTIQVDPAITVMATSKSARDGMPFNLIRLRPDLTTTKEYAVAFQCGFILRQALLSPESQWEITASEKGLSEMGAEIAKTIGNKLSGTAQKAFVQHLVSGIITQLRSVPIGLRVDQAISEEYQVLSTQQQSSIRSQLRENLSVLSPQIKGMAPDQVYNASAGMNAAFAHYWADIWADSTIAAPYKVSGFSELATNLVTLLRGIQTEPEFDQSLIDSWAAELGITGWHSFVPH